MTFHGFPTFMNNLQPAMRPVGGDIPKPSNTWVTEFQDKPGWQMPSYETRSARKTQMGHEIEEYQKERTKLKKLADPTPDQTERIAYLDELILKLEEQKANLL